MTMRGLERKTMSITLGNRTYRISYLERAGTKGSLAIFHGVGCGAVDASCLFKAPALANFHIVALDFPGHGESPYPPAGLAVHDLVDIAEGALKHVKMDQPTIIAHSMSGVVAVHLAQRLKQTKQLILIEPNLKHPPDCFWSADIKAMGAAALSEKLPSMIADFASSGNAGYRAYAADLRQVVPQAFFDYCSSLVDCSTKDGLLDILAGMVMPRTLIYGEDNKDGIPYLTYLQNSGVELIELPGGHFPMYECPELYVQNIAEIVSRQESKA